MYHTNPIGYFNIPEPSLEPFDPVITVFPGQRPQKYAKSMGSILRHTNFPKETDAFFARMQRIRS